MLLTDVLGFTIDDSRTKNQSSISVTNKSAINYCHQTCEQYRQPLITATQPKLPGAGGPYLLSEKSTPPYHEKNEVYSQPHFQYYTCTIGENGVDERLEDNKILSNEGRKELHYPTYNISYIVDDWLGINTILSHDTKKSPTILTYAGYYCIGSRSHMSLFWRHLKKGY
ncbi:unnamed protein product [Lactuca saligna]|uniref:Uncharacterized protein n=1 Tax=Lactuca saligna TaxID=75948 RepID=A0AA35ZKM3_LACSI|nr:unnamed protein product [Lactuca saligna]